MCDFVSDFFFTFFLVFYFVVHFHTDLVRLDINQFITASEKNERIAPTHVYADIPCRWCHRRCRLMHSSQNSPRIAQCNLCNCQCICMCARALVRSNFAPTKQQRTVEKKKLWSANDTQIANCMKLKQLNAICAHERANVLVVVKWKRRRKNGRARIFFHRFYSVRFDVTTTWKKHTNHVIGWCCFVRSHKITPVEVNRCQRPSQR